MIKVIKQNKSYIIMSFKHKRFPGDPLCPGRARDAFLNDFSFFLSDNHREQCSPDDPWLRARSSLGSCCHAEQVRAPRISQGGQPWRQERGRRSENGSVGFESGGCTDPVTWRRGQEHTCIAGIVREKQAVWDCVLGGGDFSCCVMNLQ